MIVCSGYWKKIKFLQFIYIQNVQGKAIEVTGYLIIGTKIKVNKKNTVLMQFGASLVMVTLNHLLEIT